MFSTTAQIDLMRTGCGLGWFELAKWSAMEGPAAIAALMTGLKLGAYGIIRFLVYWPSHHSICRGFKAPYFNC